MSRTRILVLVVVIACVASASLAAVQRERISYVAKCWNNGNQLSECACTFSALDELPDNYRALAKSWAHDAGTVYAANVMYLIVAEGQRVAANRIKDVWNTSDTKKTVQAWVWRVGNLIGWAALREAAPTVAAKLAPAAAVLPVVYDVGAEFLKARSVLDRQCRGQPTFVTAVNETREAADKIAAEIASGTMEVVTDAASTTVRASSGAAVGLWDWLKSWVWN